MTPEFDPNEAIEQAVKQHGEFLRDVDKGMSGTETSLGVDLGTVRDDARVMAELQALHSETFVELGNVVRAEHLADEAPTPVHLPAADMERLAHPGFNQVAEVGGGMRRYMEEVRAYHQEINDFFEALAIEHREMRLMLHDIRGYFERSRRQ